MLYWLALTCRESRLAARRKQVHIGAGADVDQSTVNRVVAAYADDLGIKPVELWQQAIDRWRRATSSNPRRIKPAA
jgi:hypothetical protein